ncbi:ShlB/FhaC/HecB family hemolysin secretion/activation protein [Zavarzinia compransoris]|nr:ShlB/FhaC/HecB family hemolysin secretion/activation protein [Zavarzinia compransoris]TDP46913.1 hemolysin activation/secretion protein [Zavarzinia compransoris]
MTRRVRAHRSTTGLFTPRLPSAPARALNLPALALPALALPALALPALALPVLILAAGTGPALAQSVPDAARPSIAPEAITPLPPAAAPAFEVAPAPAGSPPAGAETVTFTLSGVALDGVTAYGADELAGFYADRIGKTVSLADVFAIAAAIEAYYRADGYFLTRVVVPAQRIEGGRIQLAVVEGYIKSVAVVGDAGGAQDLVEAMAGRIAEGGGPARLDALERQLLLINDLPGLSARGTLSPVAGERGASQLTVEVTRKAVDGFVTFDNRSSRYLGPWSASAGVGANSFTALAERVEVVGFSSLFSERQRLYQLSGAFTLNEDGLTLKTYASYAPGEPGGRLSQLDLQTEATRFGFALAYPVLRGRQTNLNAGLAFDWLDEDGDAFGGAVLHDRLRVLRFTADADHRDSLAGVTRIEAGLHLGLDLFDASSGQEPNPSRTGADGTFVKGTVEISRLQRLFPLGDGAVDLLLLAAGQYSEGPLLADEEFRLGGYRFGRGYTPGEISGDRALAASAELQFTSTLDEAVEGGRFHLPYQLYAFYDAGRVWDRGVDEPGSESLTAAGAGVRLFVAETARAEVELAKPLTRDRNDRSDDERRPGLFFRLVTSF